MTLLYNIHYEVAASLFLLILITFLWVKYSAPTRVNKEFRKLAMYVLLADVLDVITAITISYGAVIPPWFNTVLNTLYVGMDIVVGFRFMCYVSAYVYPEKKQKSLLVNRIIFGLCQFIVFANIFTGQMLYFDDQGQYFHGALYLMVYIVPYYYIIYSAVILLRNYRMFRKSQRYAIACFFVLGMFGPLVQLLFFPNVLLSVFSMALGVVIIMFTLETPDYQKLIKTMGELEDLQNNLQIEVKRQTEKADRLSLMAMRTLAVTIDAKDKYTNGHSVRVAEYARELVRRSGGTQEEQDQIYYIGLLHDIGKIGVSDSIINKKSYLTDEEFEVIKTHPVIGADILKNISEVIAGIEVGARWHHERYGGGGYPDGLEGEQIPFEARVIAVADAYDAMTSKRSYRDILPQEKVREEFVNQRGKQFDPVFSDLILQMIDEDAEYQMREKQDTEE